MHKISTRVGYVNGKHPELVRLERDAWRSMLTVRFTCALARTARPKSQHYISKLSWKKYRLYFYCCISEVSKTLAQIFIVKCIVRHTWLVNFVARLSCRAHVTRSSEVGHKQHSRTLTAEIYHSGRIYWTIVYSGNLPAPSKKVYFARKLLFIQLLSSPLSHLSQFILLLALLLYVWLLRKCNCSLTGIS